MGSYIAPKLMNNVNEDSFESARRNNQYIWYGETNPSVIDKGNIIVYLEYAIAASGTLTITDGDGRTVVPGLTVISHDHSPIKLDNGITITGDVQYAKFFIVHKKTNST